MPLQDEAIPDDAWDGGEAGEATSLLSNNIMPNTENETNLQNKKSLHEASPADAYGSIARQDEEAAASTQGLSIPMMIVVALPQMAVAMGWSAQWAAFNPFLSTMLPDFAVQLTQIIGPVAGIVAGASIGLLTDRCTSKWGRRRPFLLSAGIATAACWIVMVFTRQMGEALGDYGSGKPGEPTSRTWTAALTIFFYAWMSVSLNVVQTPAFLLMADLAGDRQTTGAAIGQGLSMLGCILISVYIDLFGPAHNSMGYFLAMISFVILASVIAVCFFIKETPLKADATKIQSKISLFYEASYSIIAALMQFPSVMVVWYVINLLVNYGSSAYMGNKGQFFGIVLFGGDAANADTCGNACTPAQQSFNRGVQLAAGSTDIMYNLMAYASTWALPYLVSKFGVKNVLIFSQIPQVLLMFMAFCDIVWIDVALVVLTSISITIATALAVPIIIHVFGKDADIGVFVGAFTSASCVGFLFNFGLGAVLVQTPLGYRLPIFLGGVVSLLGVLVTLAMLKLKMYTL